MKVVRVRFRCRYCAVTFKRDFSAAEDFQPTTFAFCMPVPNPTTAGTATKTEHKWWGGKRVTTEQIRVPVLCPHCGRGRSDTLSREPINVSEVSRG